MHVAVSYSPDVDDAFIFFAQAKGRFDTDGVRFASAP
jgi:predicted solute-binding protein